jgi:hypothetical protein
MNPESIAFQIKQEITESRGRACYNQKYSEGRIDAVKHIAGLIAAGMPSHNAAQFLHLCGLGNHHAS